MRTRLVALLLLLPVVLAPGPATAEPARPVPAAGPTWSPPLADEPTVTRPFEPLPHPFAAGHRGVDLRGTPWSPVRAAADGVVAFAGMVPGRPAASTAHPDGLRTTSEPVDASVGAGQHVERGSPIGTLQAGHPGCPTEACLHWGLRRGETYLDPLRLLVVRVRPLPLRGP